MRKLVQRISKDVDFMKVMFGHDSIKNNEHAILARATFLSNVLYGSKKLSSFEMTRGYVPSVCGLPSSNLATEMIKAHEEQVARRGLAVVINGRTPRTLKPDILEKGTKVYFFRRTPPQPRWIPAFVRDAQEHLALLSTRADHAGKPVRAAYEDIRLAPVNPLLHDVDCQEPIFPRSDSLFDAESEPPYEEESDQESTEEEPEATDNQASQPVADGPQPVASGDELEDGDFWDDPADPKNMVDVFDLVNLDDADGPNAALLLDQSELGVVDSLLSTEKDLWADHPTTRSYLCEQRPSRYDEPLRDISDKSLSFFNSLIAEQRRDEGDDHPSEPAGTDITKAAEPQRPVKDVGQTKIAPPPSVPIDLDSSEQQVLRDIHAVIGDSTVSESKLSFAPRWIIDKAIRTEMENYRESGAYEEVDWRKLPRGSNIITSHHFFNIKTDGEAGRLKLKCRLVPHGNQDADKDKVRKDSQTAQFPIIRLILSLCVIFRFFLATLDIKSAYLQAGPMPRTIYVRTPKGWSTSRHALWKLLKPAYGIAESGRLWQLQIEAWMSGQGIHQVVGLPQLFIKYGSHGLPVLIIAKVVDDLLIAGTKEEVHAFHESIEKRFKVGRFLTKGIFIFNRL